MIYFRESTCTHAYRRTRTHTHTYHTGVGGGAEGEGERLPSRLPTECGLHPRTPMRALKSRDEQEGQVHPFCFLSLMHIIF